MDKCWKPGKTTAVRGCALTLNILPRKPNLIFKIVKSQCGTDITTGAFIYIITKAQYLGNHRDSKIRITWLRYTLHNLVKGLNYAILVKVVTFHPSRPRLFLFQNRTNSTSYIIQKIWKCYVTHAQTHAEFKGYKYYY